MLMYEFNLLRIRRISHDSVELIERDGVQQSMRMPLAMSEDDVFNFGIEIFSSFNLQESENDPRSERHIPLEPEQESICPRSELLRDCP
jgi:hypothetical protein